MRPAPSRTRIKLIPMVKNTNGNASTLGLIALLARWELRWWEWGSSTWSWPSWLQTWWPLPMVKMLVWKVLCKWLLELGSKRLRFIYVIIVSVLANTIDYITHAWRTTSNKTTREIMRKLWESAPTCLTSFRQKTAWKWKKNWSGGVYLGPPWTRWWM